MKNKITFGAGCFWHVQDTFSKIKGVIKATAGYMGGNEEEYPNPSYEEVCSDKTGYVEVVEVEYENNFEKLLNVFWEIHDPTSLDKQGADIGTQYKSVIFYYNNDQKKKAEKSKQEQERKLKKKIVTEIRKAGTFFKAEEYHQDYLQKHGAVCKI